MIFRNNLIPLGEAAHRVDIRIPMAVDFIIGRRCSSTPQDRINYSIYRIFHEFTCGEIVLYLGKMKMGREISNYNAFHSCKDNIFIKEKEVDRFIRRQERVLECLYQPSRIRRILKKIDKFFLKCRRFGNRKA
jgi:hypothetical protein